jgi:hypothetical protein
MQRRLPTLAHHDYELLLGLQRNVVHAIVETATQRRACAVVGDGAWPCRRRRRASVPLLARPCHLLAWRRKLTRPAWWAVLSARTMIRLHGTRDTLLAALAAHWADQQLQIPVTLRPTVRPIRRHPRPLR